MRRSILLLTILLVTTTSFAQTVEETYPKTYWCPNDTFLLKFDGSPQAYPFRVSREDKGSPGTDAAPGMHATIY